MEKVVFLVIQTENNKLRETRVWVKQRRGCLKDTENNRYINAYNKEEKKRNKEKSELPVSKLCKSKEENAYMVRQTELLTAH